MGCGSCGSGGAGCGSNGSCSTGGCNKMNAYDWLGNMTVPADPFDVVEVRFKNGRKDFFRNVNHLVLYTGDPVIVESSPGHHVGVVSLQGEIVRLQMRKKKVTYNDDLKVIYRMANKRDIEKFEQARNREMATLYRTREVIRELKLEMKLSDVEYQADNTKATFYYSADDRVDFRELIKMLASEFKIRVEMRQISLRQEAGRLGGIGSCGRELCCSTWINEFKSVSTSAARYQNLSLNPSKLSGQCGRLKCCLNYELETYLDALKDIPKVEVSLKTTKGEAVLQKTDIFKKTMWFSYKDDSNWHKMEVSRVKEIMKLNEDGDQPHSLEVNELETITVDALNTDLKQLDEKLSGKKPMKGGQQRRKKKRKKPQDFKNNKGGDTPQSEGIEENKTTFQNKKNFKPCKRKGGNRRFRGNKPGEDK